MSSPPSSPPTSTICCLRRTPAPSLDSFPPHPIPRNHFPNPRYTAGFHDADEAHFTADESEEWDSEVPSYTEHNSVIGSHDTRWSSDEDEKMSEVDLVRIGGRQRSEEEAGYESGWEGASDGAEGREELETEYSDEDEDDDTGSSAPMLHAEEEGSEDEVFLVGVSWVQQRVRAAEGRRWARRAERM